MTSRSCRLELDELVVKVSFTTLPVADILARCVEGTGLKCFVFHYNSLFLAVSETEIFLFSEKTFLVTRFAHGCGENAPASMKNFVFCLNYPISCPSDTIYNQVTNVKKTMQIPVHIGLQSKAMLVT